MQNWPGFPGDKQDITPYSPARPYCCLSPEVSKDLADYNLRQHSTVHNNHLQLSQPICNTLFWAATEILSLYYVKLINGQKYIWVQISG